MNRGEAWFHHLANLLVAGTGVVWAWMLWFVEPSDEFAIVNHPWEPFFHHAHLWFAPSLILAVGVSWKGHVWRRWRKRKVASRRSGTALLLLFAPMVISGYLIQTAEQEGLRRTWVAIHVTSSLLWVIGYLIHQGNRLFQRGNG